MPSIVSGIAIWWLFALGIILPYGWLPPLLIWGVIAIPNLPAMGRWLTATQSWPAVLILSVSLSWLVVGAWHGESGQALGLVWPLGMAVVAFFGLLVHPVNGAWLWSGVATGGFLTGAFSLIQSWQGVSRAEGAGTLDPILYGNLSLTAGSFCLAGLGWAWNRSRPWAWSLVLILGASGGLLASALSGTRGGWVTLPLLILVLYKAYSRYLSRTTLVVSMAGVFLLASMVIMHPQSGVKARLAEGAHHLVAYLEGERGVQVAARLMIWEGSAEVAMEHPLLGWGQQGSALERAHRQPRLSRYAHAHNDLLQAWISFGVPGVIGVLGLYLAPLRAFMANRAGKSRRHAQDTCGLLLAVGFMGYGLTYCFFAYTEVLAIYCSWMVALWTCWCWVPGHGDDGGQDALSTEER
ncbi:O-antigen ligase family protein [Halomonas organivorans]